MSSDILWRKIDVTPFSLIYAGAQKNIGPSGVTVVIARRDFIERGRKDLPKILQYRAFVEANSLLNTPPTFGIYLVRNVLAVAQGARAGSTPSSSATARRRRSSTPPSTRGPISTAAPSRSEAARS